MVKDNAPSPEKQLLKLIEEPNAASAAQARVRGPAFSTVALQGRLLFLKRSLASLKKAWSGPVDIRKVNFFLSVLAFGVGVYFIASSVLLAKRLSVLPSFSVKAEVTGKAAALKQLSQLKTLDYYLGKPQARDIFKLGPKAPPETPAPQATAQKQEEQNVLSKYKLVGISWSDNPDVMLEDTASKKTYFLKRNQVVEGVKVQAVFKDSVVLSYGGQEVELR